MDTVITCILILLALIGHYLDYKSEHEIKSKGQKRKYAKAILFLTSLGFVVTSITQQSSSSSLSDDIAKINRSYESLQEKLKLSDSELITLRTKLTEVKSQNDSLLKSNEHLMVSLYENRDQLQDLRRQASAGFAQNKEYLENIKTSSISQKRYLSSVQKSQIILGISNEKGFEIEIEFPSGDTESLQFARQFKEIFISAGWKVTAMAYVANPIQLSKEINLFINNVNNPPLHIGALYKAFKLVGLDCQVIEDKGIDKNKARLFINSR